MFFLPSYVCKCSLNVSRAMPWISHIKRRAERGQEGNVRSAMREETR